jgi:hypothetical protein
MYHSANLHATYSPDDPEQKLVVDVVEQALDVKL